MAQGKKIYKEIQKTVIDKDGNFITQTEQKESFIPRQEPDFVKLYLDHVLVHKDLSIKLSPLLTQICKLANYADNEQGGMMIFLNSYTKEMIRSNLNYSSVKAIEKAITQLVHNQILIRKSRGAYLLNPYFFGKGHWEDVKKIRATIDFNSGEFKPALQFGVRDSSGEEVENIYMDEDGSIINATTGEIIREGA